MFAYVCFPKLFRDMWEIDAVIQLGANSVINMFLEFRFFFFVHTKVASRSQFPNQGLNPGHSNKSLEP